MQFRFLFGLYLLIHFVSLIPYANELFGNNMPFDPKLGPTYHIFPNLLNNMNATLFLIITSIITVFFTIGKYHQVCSIILWYAWACLLNRNVLIYNPGIPYVGWLLIAMTIIPNNDNSKIAKSTFWLAWFLMGLGYTVSGIHKLDCISWLDGSALYHILTGPLARDNFIVKFLIGLNPIFLKLMTWLSLFMEISFLFLGMFYHTRIYYWFAFIMFHLGIITMVNFTDLTVGVCMIHLFTFDPRWLLL